MKAIFKLTFIFINILSLCLLQGCQTWTMGSHDIQEIRKRQPWRADESSVAGLEDRSPKRLNITPHVGFNMPIEEPSKIILKSREIPDAASRDSFKTRLDKKRRSIVIVPEKNKRY